MADGQIQIDTSINSNGVDKGLKELSKKMKDVGDSIKSTGESLTKALTVPLTAIGGIAIKMANDIQKSNGRIQAGLGVTAEEAKKLTAVAREVWKNGWGENIEDVSDSLVKVRQNMGKLNDATLSKVTEAAFMLSERFDADLNESTRAAGQLMKDFGIKGEKSMDLITWGFQNGLDYTGEWLDTLREYSPQFSEMGFTAEQMGNMIKDGFDAGAWSLDKLGDSIKESHLRMGSLDKATVEAYKSMGLNANKYVDKISKGGKEGNKAFQEVVKKLMEVDDAQERNALSTALFGTQYEDLREKVIFAMADAEKSIKNLDGTAQTAADNLHNNFGDRLKSATRTFMDSLLPIGNTILDLAERILPKITDAIKGFSEWLERIGPSGQTFLVIAGLLIAALGPLLVIIGTLITSIGAIIGVLGAVTAPVWAVIGVITALVSAFGIAYANSETFRDIVSAAFTKIKEVGMQVFEVVASFIGEKIKQIKQFWDEVGPTFLEAVKNVFNGIKAVIDFVMPAIQLLIGFVWGTIQQIISGALDVIMGLVKIFSGLFTGDWSMLWDGIKQLLKGAVNLILGLMNLSFLGGIKNIFVNLGKAVLKSSKSMITGVINFFKSLYTGAVTHSNNLVTGVLKFFTNLLSRAKSIFGTLRTFGASIFSALRSTVVNIVKSLYDKVIGNFKNIYSGAKSAFNSVLSVAKTIFNKVKSVITSPIESAKKIVTSAIDKIKSAFSNMKVKIPMPHFSFSSGTKKIAGIEVPYPKVGVDWYAKGALFPANSPRMIGIGDNTQYQEAALPLSPSVLGMIGTKIQEEMPEGSNGAGDVNVELKDVEATINIAGYQAKGLIKFITKEQVKDKDKNNRNIKGK